jgi:hypothetical protein
MEEKKPNLIQNPIDRSLATIGMTVTQFWEWSAKQTKQVLVSYLRQKGLSEWSIVQLMCAHPQAQHSEYHE